MGGQIVFLGVNIYPYNANSALVQMHATVAVAPNTHYRGEGRRTGTAPAERRFVQHCKTRRHDPYSPSPCRLVVEYFLEAKYGKNDIGVFESMSYFLAHPFLA
jgi:hypothetical protein